MSRLGAVRGRESCGHWIFVKWNGDFDGCLKYRDGMENSVSSEFLASKRWSNASFMYSYYRVNWTEGRR